MKERTVDANGIRIHLHEEGNGPLVLLLHGWPESWYSWRHQLPALAAAGFRAVAPDIRGYGRTDAPEPIEAYRMKELVADAVGILDALGEKTAIVVGHDWGAAMAWTCAALHPHRFEAVVGMSVPHLGRAPERPTALFRRMFAGHWVYVLYFQEAGVAEAELEADLERTVRLVLAGSGLALVKAAGSTFLSGMRESDTLPAWLTEQDVSYFAKELARKGLRGPLNRYRNMDRDWEELPELETLRIAQPALFIVGEKDTTRAFTPTEPMKKLVPSVEIVEIAGAGHWVQQERPDEVNAALLNFLRKLPRGAREGVG